jgi:hypothetical protein
MARLIKGLNHADYMEMATQFGGDKALSQRSMRAYLQYRLFMLDAQIDHLAHRIESSEGGAGAYWAQSDEPMSDDAWASWTSLNYLMNARDALRETLDSLNWSRA